MDQAGGATWKPRCYAALWSWPPENGKPEKEGLALLLLADAAGQPGAPYYLGKYTQFGLGILPKDAKLAEAYFRRGWAASSHVGCAVGLFTLADVADDAEALAEHLARLRALVDLPDVVELARANGSVSQLPDALWEVASHIDARLARCGFGSDATDEQLEIICADNAALARLYRLGAELRDPHMMWKTAQTMLESLTGISGLVIPLEGGGDKPAALKLCAAIVSHPKSPTVLVSKALTKLGIARCEAEPPDYPAGLAFFESAVAVGAGDADGAAVVWLTKMFYQGQGCTADPIRGRNMMMLGCKMKIGSSLLLAEVRGGGQPHGSRGVLDP